MKDSTSLNLARAFKSALCRSDPKQCISSQKRYLILLQKIWRKFWAKVSGNRRTFHDDESYFIMESGEQKALTKPVCFFLRIVTPQCRCQVVFANSHAPSRINTPLEGGKSVNMSLIELHFSTTLCFKIKYCLNFYINCHTN